MFRHLRRSWIRNALVVLRWSRACGYLAIACAGAAALLWPPASMAQATGRGNTVQLLWAGLMVVASLFCAWGAATERWVGEYVGLIPLSAVAAAFGIAALGRGHVGWAGGLFLIGFFWVLIARWQEVALIRIEAERQASNRRETDRAAEEEIPASAQPPPSDQEGLTR